MKSLFHCCFELKTALFDCHNAIGALRKILSHFVCLYFENVLFYHQILKMKYQYFYKT